jgi:hypothetical protein
MFCPQCRVEYREGFLECSDCHVPLISQLQPEAPTGEDPGEGDLDVLIRTGCWGPVAIGLAQTLLEEAGVPFFVVDQSVAVRQDSGNVFGCLDVRVPRAREAEAREILRSVEEMK